MVTISSGPVVRSSESVRLESPWDRGKLPIYISCHTWQRAAESGWDQSHSMSLSCHRRSRPQGSVVKEGLHSFSLALFILKPHLGGGPSVYGFVLLSKARQYHWELKHPCSQAGSDQHEAVASCFLITMIMSHSQNDVFPLLSHLPKRDDCQQDLCPGQTSTPLE